MEKNTESTVMGLGYGGTCEDVWGSGFTFPPKLKFHALPFKTDGDLCRYGRVEGMKCSGVLEIKQRLLGVGF